MDQLGTRVQYHVAVTNNVNAQSSTPVHLILMPDLPPGGIFYDGFEYPPGALGNWGEWTLGNTAQITSPGLTYTDGTNSLQVSGNAMVAPIDWDPFSNIPLKVFGTNTYGGANSTNFMSFLFDFTYLNSANNAGYVGVSAFEGNPPGDWGHDRFFAGKTWYGNFNTFDNRNMDSIIPYRTVTFNAVGVNAGWWNREEDGTLVSYTAPGPIVDEFRFGSTYASVAPIQAPSLWIQLLGDSVRVSWAPAAPGFVLQMSDSLTAPAWSSAPVGNPVDIPIGGNSSRYFRLLRQ
jgi:hypothetical protein